MPGSDRYRRLTQTAVVLFLTIIASGTVLTHVFMRVYEARPITWGQALLYVLETVTTVGYGDMLPFASWQMTWLTNALIVSGVSMFFFLGANLAAHWIEERVVPRAPTHTALQGHIVLTHFNDLVEEFAATLRELEVPFVVLSEDEQRAIHLADAGYDVVHGAPDDPDALHRANIAGARGVVASGPDADNIGACLAVTSARANPPEGGAGAPAAHPVRPVPVVALAAHRENARFLELAGASTVVSPKRAMGRGLVDWTLAVPTPADWPPPVAVEEGAEAIGDLNPSVFYITDGSPLAKATVGDVGQRTRALITGLWRGDELVLNPDPGEPVLGTAIIAVGETADVEGLAQVASEEDGHGPIILAGYGDVGEEAYKRLDRAGARVTVIDLEDRGVEGQVVGDATRVETLETAGAATARTLILTLDDDNKEIQAALVARTINPRLHISARAVDGASMPKFHWAGVDHPLSIPTVATRMLLQALVRQKALRPPFDAVAARRPARALEGKELRQGDIRRRTGCLVVAIAHGDDIRPAHGDEVVPPDGELILLGTRPQLARYAELFEG